MASALRSAFKKVAVPRSPGPVADRLAAAAWQTYYLAKHAGARLQDRASTTARSDGLSAGFVATPELFRAHIEDDLAPFWKRRSIDPEFGGFLHFLDRAGTPFRTDKFAVKQGRMVYAFSVAHEITREPDYLDAARGGVNFLADKMWDARDGGWYRSCTRDGTPADRQKYVIDQGYVILGLLEYHRVTGDPAALAAAVEAGDLVHQHTWDPEKFGYRVFRGRDWSQGSDVKAISAQLAMLDAWAYQYEATGDARFLEKLLATCEVTVARMLDPTGSHVRANFDNDWVYQPTWARGVIWVGYNLKTARFLLRTAELTGRADLRAAGLAIIDFCVRHGWDRRRGGFFQYLFPSGLLASSKKEWWVQCEAMIALLLAHRATSDPRYRETFEDVARFSFANFVDPEYGEWFASCNAAGAVLDTTKAHMWKAGFHTMQASFLVHHLLAGTIPTASAEIMPADGSRI